MAKYVTNQPLTGTIIKTDLGFIAVAMSDQGITNLVLPRTTPVEAEADLRQWVPNLVLQPAADPAFKPLTIALQRYAAGETVEFEQPYDLSLMTAFQQAVLTAIQAIPYGQTWSYKDVAFAIDNPQAVRAVGGALSKNPIPLMIPCHRVIGSDGKLTGFSDKGGLDTKTRLLQLEGISP